jgi:hypothetical protein
MGAAGFRYSELLTAFIDLSDVAAKPTEAV